MSTRGTSPGTAWRQRGGPDGQAFFKALHQRQGYHETGADSTGMPVYVDDGRRRVLVGRLKDGTLTKVVSHEHILRKPPSIAVQETALLQVRILGCHIVRAELPDGVTLEAPLDSFFRRGIELNRGYGLQVALPLGWWRDTAESGNQGRLAL